MTATAHYPLVECNGRLQPGYVVCTHVLREHAAIAHHSAPGANLGQALCASCTAAVACGCVPTATIVDELHLVCAHCLRVHLDDGALP